jgi:hypothetical protein
VVRCDNRAVRDLVSPTLLVVALGSWLPGLLAVVGGGALAFEVAIGHPDAVRFARDGVAR